MLCADAFFSVVNEGIFGSTTAHRYLDTVLMGGGAKSMDALFQELMSREPNPDALLQLNGIL